MSHQHQRVTGPTGVNAAAAFTSSMVDGSHPDTSRAFSPPKQGWITSQPTHTSADFSPDMVAGWHPDSPAKIFLGPKLGWSISQPTQTDAPFTPDMAFGWRPDRAVLSKPRPDGWLTSQLTIDAFSIEMAQGWQPLRAVLGKPTPRDWSIAQTTHVAAPFGIEMVSGWKPDQPRLILKPRIGWQDSQLTFDVPMTPEMFAGWHPDRARLVLGPKIALPDSQLTHIAAPFGVEMIRGWQPLRATLGKPSPTGWISNQLTFDIFSNEMVIGWQPPRAQLKKPFPLGWSISQPTHVNAPFSVEMVTGSHPDRRRPDARELLWSRELPWLGGAVLTIAPQRVSTASLTTLAAFLRRTVHADLLRSLATPLTYAEATVELGASASWRLDDSTGLVLLDAIGSRPAAFTSLTGVTFKVAGALNDGTTGLATNGTTSGTATLASPIVTGNTFTVEAWIRPTQWSGSSATGFLLANAANGEGFYAARSSGTRIKAGYQSSAAGTQSVTPLTQGTLYHWVLSVAAGVGTWYINGVADGSDAGLATSSLDTLFGASGSGALSASLIDNLAFYPVALTAQQAADRYQLATATMIRRPRRGVVAVPIALADLWLQGGWIQDDL